MKYFLIFAAFCLALPDGSLARPTFAKHALVVSESDLASQAGLQILKVGGNVVDAAVATAFALAVTRPYYASLGGGGFLLLRMNNEILALDYRERAPGEARPNMYSGGKKPSSQVGGLAVATPGNVRGLFLLHKKFGRLPWERDLAPAVTLAERGFPLTEEFVRITNTRIDIFSPAGKKYFTDNGKPLQIGFQFKQPQLAEAFKLIQKNGDAGFYEGPVAKDLVDAVRNSGGIITDQDLRNYKIRWLKPLRSNASGVEIYSMPPPSSGGAILIEEIKMAEALRLKDLKPFSTSEYHLMGEIMARSFFDRQYISDPSFSPFPADTLYGDDRIKKWTRSISRKKKTSFNPKDYAIKNMTGNTETREKGQTTHYVVADSEGNAVTATTTVNEDYGSGVFTEKFGINLNDEMDDFTTVPGAANAYGLVQSPLNNVQPFKTPLSSMTPAILEKDGKLLLALGSPGGPRIINGVFQVIHHFLTTPFNLDEIVQAPRVHHQFLPDELYHDGTLSPEVVGGLEKLGHKVAVMPIARVEAVAITPDGLLEGACDMRGEGAAAGY